MIERLKKDKFLAIVAVIYILLFITSTEKAAVIDSDFVEEEREKIKEVQEKCPAKVIKLG